MRIDITKFILINILDSCSIWNIISSKVLISNAFDANCDFSLTKFVEYECLHRRSDPTVEDDELQKIFRQGIMSKRFTSYQLSIEDIQEPNLLENRKKLGIGELSSIAFAKKVNQAFLTDDQNARKLAEIILGKEKVQTTPHLLGWLFFNGRLGDSDLELIISEHNFYKRPLEKYFRETYHESLRIKSLLKY